MLENQQRGFTLIELLVAVTIVGILASIAIPAAVQYRVRGFNARIVNDLKNAATAEESYFVDSEQYVDCATISACESVLPGFRGSPGISVSMTRVPETGSTPEHFTGMAYHPQGSWSTPASAKLWDSENGGLQ